MLKQTQYFFFFLLQDLKVRSTILDILGQIKEEAKFLATTTKYIHQKRERQRKDLGINESKVGCYAISKLLESIFEWQG